MIKGWVGNLLPHEFVHAWCGKYRRPAGMVTENFHTPKDTTGLWVYEGLTQYLGNLLAVRSGLWDLDYFKQYFANVISSYKHRTGREWRSLADTAVDTYHLRGGTKSWSAMRRNQDYYSEGMLIWIEVDAILRNKTDGRKSLDDFCRAFFGPDQPKRDIVSFDRAEIIALLEAIAPNDWANWLQSRVDATQEQLPLSLVRELGYRLEYDNSPSDYVAKAEKSNEFVSAIDSLGISVSRDGKVSGGIVPGMAAERAGISPGMEIVAVNGKKFSKGQFMDALADSVALGKIELSVFQGEALREIVIPYGDGPKYLSLTRNEGKADRLEEIMAPRKE